MITNVCIGSAGTSPGKRSDRYVLVEVDSREAALALFDEMNERMEGDEAADAAPPAGEGGKGK